MQKVILLYLNFGEIVAGKARTVPEGKKVLTDKSAERLKQLVFKRIRERFDWVDQIEVDPYRMPLEGEQFALGFEWRVALAEPTQQQVEQVVNLAVVTRDLQLLVQQAIMETSLWMTTERVGDCFCAVCGEFVRADLEEYSVGHFWLPADGTTKLGMVYVHNKCKPNFWK